LYRFKLHQPIYHAQITFQDFHLRSLIFLCQVYFDEFLQIIHCVSLDMILEDDPDSPKAAS
ncbi:unnamed protein product, partial [Tuber aestivum]